MVVFITRSPALDNDFYHGETGDDIAFPRGEAAAM